MAGTTLETERLLIRPQTPRDAPFILELVNEPGFVCFIGDRGVRNIADAEVYTRRTGIDHHRRFGFALDLVVLRESGEPIGLSGLLKRAELDAPDLGFAFLEHHTGKGYATEAGRAVLEHSFGDHGAARVYGVTRPGNDASVRVLTKLGFEPDGVVEISGLSEPNRLFVLRKLASEPG